MINWDFLSKNPNAIHILENNLDKVNWINLCFNSNPRSINILESKLDIFYNDIWFWNTLCNNLNAINILENNLYRINFSTLSLNPNAINILEKNMDKINLFYLSRNPNAIHLLFKLDYGTMRNNMIEFNKELTRYVLNPKRLLNISKIYNIDIKEYLDLIYKF